MSNSQAISKIGNIIQRAYNSHPRGQNTCYRNRLGLDALTAANTILKPLYITTTIRMLEQSFEGIVNNAPLADVAVTLRNNVPSYAIKIKYSGEDAVNINSEINGLIHGTAFPSRAEGTGTGECIRIINYRTKAQLEKDVQTITESGEFTRAEKATEIYLTAAPYTVVRLFEKPREHGIIRLLLTYSLTSDVVNRLKGLVYADQCASFAKNTALKPICDYLVAHTQEFLNENNVIYSQTFVETLLKSCFKDRLEALEKAAENARREAIKKAVEKIPQASIRQKEEACENAEHRYKDALRSLKDYEETFIAARNAYEAALHEEDKVQQSVATFFNALGAKLRYIDMIRDELYVIADTTLQFFDKKKLEPYKGNPRSALREASPYVQHLLEEVFETRTAIIHITAGFRMSLVTGRLEVIRRGTVGNALYTEANRTGLPNPHHEHYNCFGENQEICRKLVKDGKLDEALMTAYAATGGLNISDTAVFNKFVRDIEVHECGAVSYIEKNGVLMTIGEYQKAYEKEQEEQRNA